MPEKITKSINWTKRTFVNVREQKLRSEFVYVWFVYFVHLCAIVHVGLGNTAAVKMITEIKAKGGVLRSFRSICRGLPAPEFADNPFYYKFSWSARGVLEAAKNAAMYLKDGKMVNILGGDLFLHAENVGLDTKHPKLLFYHKIGGNTGNCF